MPQAVKPVPEGSHTVTPYLALRDAARALDFYKKAFGAEEIMRMPMPGGGIMHAEIRIGDSQVMLSDEFPGAGVKSPESAGTTTASLYLYVEDVDAAFHRAVAAGARPVMPPADMFWGDRYASVADPFGHQWGIATHKEDVPPEEMKRRGAEWMSKMGQPG